MHSFWVAPGLRFNDCVFSEPVNLAQWIPPSCAGVAVVLARDPEWAPKPFRPLYFGEFGNEAQRSTECGRWTRHRTGDFYISVLPMPFSTTAQRRALRNELVSAYNPLCQAAGTPSADELARKLDDLETRQHEQNAQILALLAHIAKLFEPQPVTPGRPIGFRPLPVPLGAQSES